MSADGQGKTSDSRASRFSGFGFGSQLLQKTVGLVLRPRSGRQVVCLIIFLAFPHVIFVFFQSGCVYLFYQAIKFVFFLVCVTAGQIG